MVATPEIIDGQRAARRRAEEQDIQEILQQLEAALGRALVAVAARVADAGDLHAPNGGMHDSKVERRLRHTYAVLEFIRGSDSPHTVRSWFMGMNPALEGKSPVEVIGEDPDLVMDAAYAFVAGDYT